MNLKYKVTELLHNRIHINFDLNKKETCMLKTVKNSKCSIQKILWSIFYEIKTLKEVLILLKREMKLYKSPKNTIDLISHLQF